MYRVLLPVDESEERVDEQVAALLSLPGDEDEFAVTVLHVIEEIDTVADEAGPTMIDDINESLPDIRGESDTVQRVERRLEDAGIDVQREEMVGDPADCILQMATDIDADTVVLGARNRSPAGKAIFGSVSQKVILETDRPVLVSG